MGTKTPVEMLQGIVAEIDERKAEVDALFAKRNRSVVDERAILDKRIAISNLEDRAQSLREEHGFGKGPQWAAQDGVHMVNGGGDYREEHSVTGYELRAGETFASRVGGKRELTAGEILQAAVGRGSADVRNAMSGLSSANGEVLLPAYVSGDIIDAALEQSALVRAGARRVEMLARNHTLPRVVSDPVLGWRAELGVVAENAEPTIDGVQLTARSVAGVCVVSWELLEDASGLGDAITRSLGRSVARAIDKAALAESNTSNGPDTLFADGNITEATATFTSTTYAFDDLIDIAAELGDAEVGGLAWAIMPHPDIAGLRKLRGDGGWLGMPPALAAVNLIGSAQMDPASAYILAGSGPGAIAIGMINDVRIRVLQERYAVSQSYAIGTSTGNIGGAVGFLVSARVDVAAVDPQRLLRVATSRGT